MEEVSLKIIDHYEEFLKAGVTPEDLEHFDIIRQIQRVDAELKKEWKERE